MAGVVVAASGTAASAAVQPPNRSSSAWKSHPCRVRASQCGLLLPPHNVSHRRQGESAALAVGAPAATAAAAAAAASSRHSRHTCRVVPQQHRPPQPLQRLGGKADCVMLRRRTREGRSSSSSDRWKFRQRRTAVRSQQVGDESKPTADDLPDGSSQRSNSSSSSGGGDSSSSSGGGGGGSGGRDSSGAVKAGEVEEAKSSVGLIEQNLMKRKQRKLLLESITTGVPRATLEEAERKAEGQRESGEGGKEGKEEEGGEGKEEKEVTVRFSLKLDLSDMFERAGITDFTEYEAADGKFVPLDAPLVFLAMWDHATRGKDLPFSAQFCGPDGVPLEASRELDERCARRLFGQMDFSAELSVPRTLLLDEVLAGSGFTSLSDVLQLSTGLFVLGVLEHTDGSSRSGSRSNGVGGGGEGVGSDSTNSSSSSSVGSARGVAGGDGGDGALAMADPALVLRTIQERLDDKAPQLVACMSGERESEIAVSFHARDFFIEFMAISPSFASFFFPSTFLLSAAIPTTVWDSPLSAAATSPSEFAAAAAAAAAAASAVFPSALSSAWQAGQVGLSVLLAIAAGAAARSAAASYWGVQSCVNVPVPIPSFFFGSLGTITTYRGVLPNRKAVLDLSLASTIASLTVSALLIYAGYSATHSDTAGTGMAAASAAAAAAVGSSSVYVLIPAGLFAHSEPLTNLSTALATAVFVNPATGGSELALDPLALGGLLGLHMTALSLLPIGGVTEGGRIAKSTLGSRLCELLSLVVGVAMTVKLFGTDGATGVVFALVALLLNRHSDWVCWDEVTDAGALRKTVALSAVVAAAWLFW